MYLLINKSVRKLLMVLAAALLAGVVVFQMIAYADALYMKDLVISHDYEAAGYLMRAHPEMASEIRRAFTSEKSSADMETGRALLMQSGYRQSTELFLLPHISRYYRMNAAVNLAVSLLLGLSVLLAAYVFLKSHFKVIDRYNDAIAGIMEGNAISSGLEDIEEGSLPKLAASINIMTSSLFAHIEKEKQNRLFMKDILENVSHQLKTPLSALLMYNEIMREEDVHNEVLEKFLSKSNNELERMQSLTVSLLKMARLDAGIIELNRKNHKLKDIIGEVIGSFETRLQQEQKTYVAAVFNDVEYCCDREWMHEALSNLVKNAVEHTDAGDNIKVALEESPLIVKIIVEDNGEGIHPDDINHIFKRFYRSRFSQNKQGTGIGLALVKTVIEMHGGFVSVESTVGKGTKFTVHLPNLQNCKLQ